MTALAFTAISKSDLGITTTLWDTILNDTKYDKEMRKKYIQKANCMEKVVWTTGIMV